MAAGVAEVRVERFDVELRNHTQGGFRIQLQQDDDPMRTEAAEIEVSEIDKIGHQGRGHDAEAAASQPQSP